MEWNLSQLNALPTAEKQRQWNKCLELTDRYGLKLTHQRFEALEAARKQALEAAGRLDFGGGVLDSLVYAFCDSPFVEPDAFAGLLFQMQELFYTFKSETLNALTDEELISVMERLFNGEAQGSLDYLSEVPPQRLVRIALGKEALD